MDVKTLCLAVLSHGPASGYEIKKALEEGPYAYFYRASFGAIYPSLAQLHRSGFVAAESRSQVGRPDKRVYSLTPDGHRELVRALHGEPAPDYLRSDFILMMFHADLLSSAHRRAVIDARVRWLREQLACLDEARAKDPAARRYHGAGPAFACGLGRTIYAAELAYLESSRAQLEDAPEPPLKGAAE